jgi:hypothetical protein
MKSSVEHKAGSRTGEILAALGVERPFRVAAIAGGIFAGGVGVGGMLADGNHSLSTSSMPGEFRQTARGWEEWRAPLGWEGFPDELRPTTALLRHAVAAQPTGWFLGGEEIWSDRGSASIIVPFPPIGWSWHHTQRSEGLRASKLFNADELLRTVEAGASEAKR